MTKKLFVLAVLFSSLVALGCDKDDDSDVENNHKKTVSISSVIGDWFWHKTVRVRWFEKEVIMPTYGSYRLLRITSDSLEHFGTLNLIYSLPYSYSYRYIENNDHGRDSTLIIYTSEGDLIVSMNKDTLLFTHIRSESDDSVLSEVDYYCKK